MILTTEPSTLVNVGETQRTMTSKVNEHTARRLMHLLTDAYPNPIVATVREAIANAADAVRRAGTGLPVEVTSPTPLEPTLTVTDRGIGMTVEDVEENFLAFANSSKSDNNDEVGGLGIGAKSPWTVSESFTVDTVRNGQRTIVQARKDLEHQVIMAGEPTDLPNGTTIIVPIPDLSGRRTDWHRAIMEAATAHDQGAVLVDGQEVTSLDGPARIGPMLCRQLEHRDSSILIRSGGTLFESVYEVRSKVNRVVKLKSCIIELPIGSFDHTPNRESVTATAKTLAAIDAALTEYGAAYAAVRQELNDLAKVDVTAAVKRREEILGDVATFDTLPIDLNLEVPDTIGAWACGSKAWKKVNRDRDPNADSCTDVIPATGWDREAKNTVLVTGVPADKKLSRFATYIKNRFNNIRRVIPLPVGATSVALNVTDKPGQPTGQTFIITPDMVPADHVYAWDEWLEVTTAHLGGSRGGSSGPRAGYDCWVIAADGEQATRQSLTGKEIAALGLPVHYTAYEGRYGQKEWTTLPVASVRVSLGTRKEEALLKAVPTAVSVRVWQKRFYDNQIATLTDLMKLALAVNECDHERMLSVISAARQRIIDQGGDSTPMLDQAALLSVTHSQLTEAQKKLWNDMGRHGSTNKRDAALTEIRQLVENIHSAWPLLKGYRTYNSQGIDRAAWIEYVSTVAPRGNKEV